MGPISPSEVDSRIRSLDAFFSSLLPRLDLAVCTVLRVISDLVTPPCRDSLNNQQSSLTIKARFKYSSVME